MNTPDHIRGILESLAAGRLDVAGAMEQLQPDSSTDLGYARIDTSRIRRRGFPEVIFGENKTANQIIGIVRAIEEAGQNVLCTRVDEAKASAVMAALEGLTYNVAGRTLVKILTPQPAPPPGEILVLSAGTSDLSVAEEATVTLEFLGDRVTRVFDVGVAGIHRLFEQSEAINRAAVIVCVAGMEGALPSVVAGLCRAPVVAVPTSVGYGAAFGGLAALLGMLNSCSGGVAVVNIDNGFGGAQFADLILRSGQARMPPSD